LSVIRTFRRSFNLLNKIEKRKLIIAIFWQGALNILDLLGVLSLSLTTYTLTNKSLPKFSFFQNFKNENLHSLSVTLISLTIALFTIKGFVAPILYSRIMKYLTRISINLSESITRTFFAMPRSFHQKYRTQETIFSLSQGITSAVNEVLGSSIILFSETLLLFFLIFIMLISNWVLTLLNFVLFSLTLYILAKKVGGRQYNNSKARIESVIQGNSSLMDIITGFREIFVSNKLDYFLDQFIVLRKKESKAASSGLVLNILPKYIFEITFYLCAGGVLVFLYNFTDEKYAFSLFVLFIASGTRILPSILRIQASVTGIRSNEALSNATFTLISDLNSNKRISTPSTTRESQFANGILIYIESLKFSYPENPKWQLKIENLKIPSKAKVAIVGPSGSGKSTLIDLILGILEPDQGFIYFNSGSKLSSEEFKIAYMPQQISILNRTLRENIAFGVLPLAIDDKSVLESISKSGLTDFVETLPGGIHQVLNESGTNLSGGQKQRIGFARALYQKPNLLILDEATSSLDSESEFLISDAVSNLTSDVTVVSIAHRLSTIKNFDLIIYMENGRVSEIGTFKELREKSSSFNLQAKLMEI